MNPKQKPLYKPLLNSPHPCLCKNCLSIREGGAAVETGSTEREKILQAHLHAARVEICRLLKRVDALRSAHQSIVDCLDLSPKERAELKALYLGLYQRALEAL